LIGDGPPDAALGAAIAGLTGNAAAAAPNAEVCKKLRREIDVIVLIPQNLYDPLNC